MKLKTAFFSVFSLIIMISFASCASGVASAEEFFEIGMAYFELGRFDEAERWLNRARSVDRTMTASEYNLGRIAFETGRYDEAFFYFNRVIQQDPENVMALRAAAFTKIKLGDLASAEALYTRVLELTPESADDGYNHALVLFAMQEFERSEEVLLRYEFALLENSDVILLLARILRAQNKPEAMNRYAQWLEMQNDVLIRYEYAAVLRENEFYARALEEYRIILTELPQNAQEPSRGAVHFAIASVLLTADPENPEGISELETAVQEGFDNTEALETLLTDERISTSHQNEIRRIITRTPEPEPIQEEGGEDENSEI